MKLYIRSSNTDYDVERLTEKYVNSYLDSVEDIEYEKMVDYVSDMVFHDMKEKLGYLNLDKSRLFKQVAMTIDENWDNWVM